MDDKDDLASRIASAQSKRDKREGEISRRQTPKYTGAHAGIEFALAILLGGFIGYLIDGWLGTPPIFLISMFFFGVATGFYNLYRFSQNMGSAIGFSGLRQGEKDDKNMPNKTKVQAKINRE
jgi:ATP synthase protein I